MKLFSQKEKRSIAVQTEQKERQKLVDIQVEINKRLSELNGLKAEINGFKKREMEKVIEEIMVLDAKKQELHLSVSSLENRRRDALKPIKAEFNQLKTFEKELFDREGRLENRVFDIEKKEEKLAQEMQKTVKTLDIMRKRRDEYGVLLREAKLNASKEAKSKAEAVKLEEEWTKKIDKANKLIEQYNKWKKDLSDERKGYLKMFKNKEDQLKKERAIINDERDKLKIAIEVARNKYGVKSKG